MISKKTTYIATAAMIAALYVVMTFVSSMFGLSSGAIQIRLSEALNTLACYTSAAIPGMFVGCLVANLITGGCSLDLVFGSIATLIGVTIGREIAIAKGGKYNLLVPIPTILSNALIIPFVLQKGYGFNLPYYYLFVTVGLGEVISAGLMGMFLYFSLLRIPDFRTLVKSTEQYPTQSISTFKQLISVLHSNWKKKHEENDDTKKGD